MRAACLFLVALTAGVGIAAQDIRVYSEFTRIDPFGQVVRADHGAAPREILSPAVPRNGYSTFRVVVLGQPGTAYTLYAGQNPENAVGLEVYREVYTQSNGEWIPDRLELVSLPHNGVLGTAALPGQAAQSFLRDLRVEERAPVRRIKVQPQVWMNDRWIEYPIEVRVVSAAVPEGENHPPRLPDVTDPADAAVAAAYQAAVCSSGTPAGAATELTARSLAVRNAGQDVRKARAGAMLPEKKDTPQAQSWCGPFRANPLGPEWYLRTRDALYRARE